jgi:hypothetical protein
LEHSNFASDPAATGKALGKMMDKTFQSTAKGSTKGGRATPSKIRLSQSMSQSSQVSNKTPFQLDPGSSKRGSVSMSVGLEPSLSTTANNSTILRSNRRSNIGLDEINIQRSMKNAGHLEMLKNIDNVIASLWSAPAHPFLYLDPNILPANQMTMVQYILGYVGDLDIAGSAVQNSDDTQLNSSEEPSLNSNNKKNPWSHLSPAEQPMHHIRIDMEQALHLAENLTISIQEFVLVTVRAWNMEYETIKGELQRLQLQRQRRAAITGHYDARHAKMTAQERLTITRLLQWYKRGEDLIGVDWDEVEAKSGQHYFPFSLPKSLLSKSHNELQVLTDQVIQTLIAQAEQSRSYEGKKALENVNLYSSKVNAYGTVASLLPHPVGDQNNTLHQMSPQNSNESEPMDLIFIQGISGGTAIQDDLPDDEVRLLVGQVSPRDIDEGTAVSTVDAPSVTSSIELYMLASELERGMGYTNSIFPTFRKQELEIEQAMRLGIADEDDHHFNHRHHDFDEHSDGHHSSHQHHQHQHHHHHHNDDKDDLDDDDHLASPEHAREQWRKSRSLTAAFRVDKTSGVASEHLHHRATSVLKPSPMVTSPMKRATSFVSASSVEGSSSLSNIENLLPPLDAPTLDPSAFSSADSLPQKLRPTDLSMSTLPEVHSRGGSGNNNNKAKRLQSPANGGERPPSGSLVRFQMDKKRRTTSWVQESTPKGVITSPNPATASKKPEGNISGVGQLPGKKINIVDMIDVDGEVLERSGLTPGLSKPLIANPKVPQKRANDRDGIFEDTSLNSHPLEDSISSFSTSNRIRSGSKLNRKPVHNVQVDIVEDHSGAKQFATKIVVVENFANSAFQRSKKKDDVEERSA